MLAVRSDSMGDVLVTGPALRAMAASAEVVLLCGPRGLEAARLLPSIAEIVCAELPWIDPEPKPVEPAEMHALVGRIAGMGVSEAVIFTSFHQGPLPLALLMRMAGVKRVSAISDDYPGSLLDVRLRDLGDVHEAERTLILAAAAGFNARDDCSLRIVDPGVPIPSVSALAPYVVVHPGASVPARMWPADTAAQAVRLLRDAGWHVVVTGAPDERALTARVAGDYAEDLGGRLSLRELAAVIRRAAALVVPNTGPAHLAAAVGTPVVSLFAPVVPAARWRPWRVRHVLLGDQHAACAGSRARQCPVAGHPCLGSVPPERVVDAVAALTALGAVA